jgi:hypothetical protein
MKRPMVAFLTQLLLVIRSWFARRARLEAENLILRQQLIVLCRRRPKRVRLLNIDRLLMVWLYRLYPSLLDASSSFSRDSHPLAPTRIPRLLALEVPPHRRPSTDSFKGSGADPAGEPREPSVGRCVQRRLARSVGGNPTKAKSQQPCSLDGREEGNQ